MTEARRLSDKIAAAHGQACAERCQEVAELLLQALEVELTSLGTHAGTDEHRDTMQPLEDEFVRHEQSFGSAPRRIDL